jgi:hypothetical protein
MNVSLEQFHKHVILVYRHTPFAAASLIKIEMLACEKTIGYDTKNFDRLNCHCTQGNLYKGKREYNCVAPFCCGYILN